jgi:methylthioribose-1-phosphate isomerase
LSCSVVTLGIGNDIKAEEALHQLLPNARFIGADPILSSGQVYNQIGQYLQVVFAENIHLFHTYTYFFMWQSQAKWEI